MACGDVVVYRRSRGFDVHIVKIEQSMRLHRL